MSDNLEKAAIQWHLGFCAAAEIEFALNKKELAFSREYNLSKTPVRMDLLIIKKSSDIPIQNEIGHIFKTYNIVEYKSPDDGLTIDDYVKTVGYACLYKGLGETVDQIPLKEMTVSIFRENYPRKLIAVLKREGFAIEKRYNGIYYISGRWPFATQIIVTRQLDRKVHRSLCILSKHALEEDVRAFLETARRFTEPGDRNNADAILQVSVSANQELYEQIRRDSVMCEALRELMKDEIAKEKQAARQEARREGLQEGRQEGLQEGRREGRQEGRKEGQQEALLAAIKNLMVNLKLSAERAMAALGIPQVEYENYTAKL